MLDRLPQQSVKSDGTTYDVNLAYVATTGLLDTLEYPVSTSGYRLKLGYDYANGQLKRVKHISGAPVYWEAVSTDAWGHIQDENFGNGVRTVTYFDQASGFMKAREGGLGGGTGLIHSLVDWDLNGNLKQRQDLKLSPSVTEEFFYDNLNRFDKSERTPAGGITETNAYVTLDAIGNISWKLGVGSYTYHATQKRAVTAAGGFSFDYDANGNMTSRNGSSISYTSYNLPSVINAGAGTSSTLSYGAFRNRYKQVAVTPSTGTETTIYVAGLMEKVTRGSSIEYRHLIHGGQGAAAIHTRVAGGASSTYYLHRDHLGSPELITDSSGNEVVRPSFGAYGERRDGTDWSGPPSTADLTDIANTIRRGFTGHEHLDSVGLIHMNGRVYEPVAGRFLGVDPIVHLGSSQSPNSYSYVWNNPLTLIDPSGFDGEDVVTEGDSQPRYFPQCPYQIANIVVDCTYRYGWRWSDLRVIDLWLMDEWRVEMWVRSMDARTQPQAVIASNAQWSNPGPVTGWKLSMRGAGQLVVEGVIGSIPVVGTVVGIYDAITVFSDGNSTNMERTLAVVGVLPGGKWIRVLVRGVGGDVLRAVGRGADDAARGLSHWGNPRTLARHFRDHGADFGAKSADDYARQASDFFRRSQADRLPTKIDADGVIRVYDPRTNTFGSFNPDGTTRTFLKPTSPTYFDRQPGGAPWAP